MDQLSAINAISPFNMELLMTSIANNDNLVRNYHEKCAENAQIQQKNAQMQQNLDSISETAQQIQQLYTNEKERKDQLIAENADLKEKLQFIQNRLETVENERINNDTLNQQTIAELEEKLEKSNKKYLNLCETFVEQANILHVNNLSSTQLMRKCTAIKDILQSNGIPFEWNRSPSKQRSKSTTDKPKTKSTRTFGTQANLMECNLADATPKKITCEKSTQYQQSKTTRSTCTSAFIHTVDMSTNTDEHFDRNTNLDAFVESILEDMVPVPNQLSPIYENVPGKMSNSTQTKTPHFRTQGTITTISNVRKRVNYVQTRAHTKSNTFYEVKKEECLSPCPSPRPSNSNIFTANSLQNDTIALNWFHHLWQLVGELLYQVAGQGNAPVDNKSSDDMRIVQKIYEIQNLMKNEKAMHSKAVENADTDNINIDSDDEQSRDSIESYNSAKVFISKIRNLSNCSPMPDDNAMCSTSDTRQTTFRPITSMGISEFETELYNSSTNVSPQMSPTASPSPSPTPKEVANRNHRKESIQREQSPTTSKRALESQTNCRSTSCSPIMSESQIKDNAHFKVPKRKSSITESDFSNKKRKTLQVSISYDPVHLQKTNMTLCFQIKSQKEELRSLFGDLSDDEDEVVDDEQIYRILESVKVPKMLSPIKDLPDDLRMISPLPVQLNMDDHLIPQIDSLESTNLIVSHSQLASQTPEPIDDAINRHETADSVECTNPTQIQSAQTNDPLCEITEMPSEIVSQEVESEPIQADEAMEIKRIESEANTEVVESSDKEHSTTIDEQNEEIVRVEISEFDYYSPASPKREDQVSTEQVPIIPDNTITGQCAPKQKEDDMEQCQISTDSVLDREILNYVPSTRNKIQSSSYICSFAECYLIASVRNAIEMHCLDKEWTMSTVTEIIDKLLTLSRQPKHLAISILEVVEDTKEDLSLECTPPAPALQPSHQKCLLLVSRLVQFIPSFDKYLQFELEKRMFTLQSKEKPTMAMTNLAHFFIALVDIEQPTNRSKVLLFIYKCLYYFKVTAVPLVFTVIMAHPHALPHANTVEFISDPLIRAIVSTLSNIVYTDVTRDRVNKKWEMFHTLKRRYGFFMDKLFPTDSVVDYCIECIRANRLQHVDYALILIAKRQDADYSMGKILEKHLIPMLQQYVSLDLMVNTEHDEKICTILFTIGSIVKTLPIEQNILGFLRIFVTCLNATQRQCIQEAAISAIFQTSRFGTTQIYPHLASWKPNYTISTDIQAMLKTFVYRKPQTFWFANEKVKK